MIQIPSKAKDQKYHTQESCKTQAQDAAINYCKYNIEELSE